MPLRFSDTCQRIQIDPESCFLQAETKTSDQCAKICQETNSIVSQQEKILSSYWHEQSDCYCCHCNNGNDDKGSARKSKSSIELETQKISAGTVYTVERHVILSVLTALYRSDSFLQWLKIVMTLRQWMIAAP